MFLFIEHSGQSREKKTEQNIRQMYNDITKEMSFHFFLWLAANIQNKT